MNTLAAKAIRLASRLKARARHLKARVWHRSPPTARQRIARLYLHGQGVEIGGLHMPLDVPRWVKVRQLDRMTLPELRAHYPELAEFKLVEPTLIDDGETLSTLPDASLDFVIANHVIEHCQNPIGTLRHWLRALKTEGIIYMIVPDKRLTFDRERPITALEHLLRDFDDPAASRRGHYEEWVDVVENLCGDEAAARVQLLMKMDYSIHFHVWTPLDFLSFLQGCAFLLTPFELELFEKTASSSS